MEHLTAEALARLVDDEPQPTEQAHLEACEACSRELAAFREQTDALSTLPEIVPPLDDWAAIEAQLRSEGLVRDPTLRSRLRLARTPSWMPAAAAVVLFLGGAAAGSSLVMRGGAAPTLTAATVEDAATAVRTAEQQYVSAVSNYRALMAAEGIDDTGSDPISRYAALEQLVSVSQAAVRHAPGDPFLNGFLASALAERDAVARMVSLTDDNWF